MDSGPETKQETVFVEFPGRIYNYRIIIMEIENKHVHDYQELLCDVIDCMSSNDLSMFKCNIGSSDLIIYLINKRAIRLELFDGEEASTYDCKIEDIYHSVFATDNKGNSVVYKIDNTNSYFAAYLFVILSVASNELKKLYPGYW